MPILKAITAMCQSWKLLQLCANPKRCYTTVATGATNSVVTQLLQQMPPIMKDATPTVTCFNLQD